MPVKRRRSRHRREAWRYEHVVALSSGNRYFGAFGSHREPWRMDEAREAWAELGEGILKTYRREKPTLRPWGWWTFAIGVEQPHGQTAQRRYLLEHGHLSPTEVEMLRVDPTLLEPTPLEVWMGCR